MRTNGQLAMAQQTGLNLRQPDERHAKPPYRQEASATQQASSAMMNSIKEAGLNGTGQPAHRPHNQRVTVVLPTSLIERLRNAVYWTGDRTLARLITDAVDDVVSDLEHANGGAFPARLSPLKRGRPVRKSVPPRASRSPKDRTSAAS